MNIKTLSTTELKQKADKLLKSNQKWAKSKAGKKAMERITGESYNKEEMAEWGLEHEIRMAREVLGDKKVKDIIKNQM